MAQLIRKKHFFDLRQRKIRKVSEQALPWIWASFRMKVRVGALTLSTMSMATASWGQPGSPTLKVFFPVSKVSILTGSRSDLNYLRMSQSSNRQTLKVGPTIAQEKSASSYPSWSKTLVWSARIESGWRLSYQSPAPSCHKRWFEAFASLPPSSPSS